MATKSPYIRLLQGVLDTNAAMFRRAFGDIQQFQVTPEKAEAAARNLMSNTLHTLVETLSKTKYAVHPLPEDLPETGWVVGFSDLRNLSHGRPAGAYVVLLEKNVAVWGAYLDFLGARLCWAAPGEGSHAERKLRVAGRQQLTHGLLALPWRTGDTRSMDLLKIANDVDLHTRKTSQPIQDALALAGGEVDVLVQASLAPAEALLMALFIQEAGGFASDLKGRPVSVTTQAMVAANSKLHGLFLKQLRNAA